MSRAWQGGSSREWRRIRREVLARDRARKWLCRAHDDGWCRRAGAGPHDCERFMTQVHHVRGRLVTGDDVRYLVGSCPPCNYAIGDPQAARGEPACEAVTLW
jgi:hypothetical protein